MKTSSTRSAQCTLKPMTYGRYIAANGTRVILPYSQTELERARQSAIRLLNNFHFPAGGNILLTALIDQTAQLLPVERAIMSTGRVVVSADATFFDAKRVESILRRFELTAAIGITAETLDGLEQLGHDPAQLLKGLTLWAKPHAYKRLKNNPEINALRLLEVGPATAMECRYNDGAHIDRTEWQASEREGEIILSSRLARCTEFDNYATGLYGQINNTMCACGNADPRIILND